MNAETRYVTRLLDRYRKLPGTLGHVLRDDRRTARNLQHRHISLDLVDQAFLLALGRRTFRDDTEPLAPIRTLRYFLPIIQELLDSPLDPAYQSYLQRRLREAGLDPPA